MKKPFLQHIIPPKNTSFLVEYSKSGNIEYDNFWHFHPEYEIAYVPHGKGKRFIGHRISMYNDGDLVMLGPKIPHNTLYYGYESSDYEQYVILFDGSHISEMKTFFPEFEQVEQLLKKSSTGLYIRGKQKHELGNEIKKMFQMNTFDRLMALFTLLNKTAKNTTTSLRASSYLVATPESTFRLQKVYAIIREDFMQKITTQEVANNIGMTESSFCRFFLKNTGRSFKQALIDYRINEACTMLANTNLPIGIVAIDSGFSNASMFSKYFKKIVGERPLAYRSRFYMEINA
ncbi:MAG: hypothetical protein COA50_06750 [Flavobacteriaceae bacterium]|nr:MAG: hypothetical protein COA50_06750 [Flavobacteriaceae bacterium]